MQGKMGFAINNRGEVVAHADLKQTLRLLVNSSVHATGMK